MATPTTLCVLPKITGIGGPASFYSRLVTGLRALGYEVTADPDCPHCAALLVIGGPGRLAGKILKARRRGIPVVQRLNGRNWMHRRGKGNARYFIRAEVNNLTLTFIRRYLADRIVYQSRFAQGWWNRAAGSLNKPARIIYNSVDLKQFSPQGISALPQHRTRLLLVEGRLGGGYEQGLANAMSLAARLQQRLSKPVELAVVGEVAEQLRKYWEAQAGVAITWLGVLGRDQIPETDRSAHLMFSADINAACPNAVIEAMACGLPVVGFDTGALSEVIGEKGGMTAPYGSDYWKLETPVIEPLAAAAEGVLADMESFRNGARQRAEMEFNLDLMLQKYLEILLS